MHMWIILKIISIKIDKEIQLQTDFATNFACFA